MPQTTAKPPDQRHTKPQQPIANSARIHDVGGDDKQRHRQQDKALVKPIHQHLARNANALARRKKIQERSNQDGIGNRRTNPG